MTFLPRKKPRLPKLGLREPAVLYSQKHRQWIRRFACVVPGCSRLPIETAHVRAGLPAGESAGMAQKPSDLWTIPLCSAHHRGDPYDKCFEPDGTLIYVQHQVGEPEFATKYGLNLVKLALAYASKSPDERIREKAASMRELV